MLAAGNGFVNITNLLLKHRADPNLLGPAYNGESALHTAASNGRLDCVLALLDAKANVNLQAKGNEISALHLATRNGHFDVARALCVANANVNLQDKFLKSPLHDAAAAAAKNFVALLIQHRADVNLEDIDSFPPLNYTYNTSHPGCKPIHSRAETCACYFDVTNLLSQAGAAIVARESVVAHFRSTADLIFDNQGRKKLSGSAFPKILCGTLDAIFDRLTFERVNYESKFCFAGYGKLGPLSACLLVIVVLIIFVVDLYLVCFSRCSMNKVFKHF